MKKARWHRTALHVGLSALLALAWSSAQARDGFSPYVDDSGRIRLPDDFRASMVRLGSWFVPTGGAGGFHGVGTGQRTVDVYRKTGRFPDGATLVKELRPPAAGNYGTGQGVSHWIHTEGHPTLRSR